jgi:curli production assembly/transport component CsgG
MGDTIGKSKKTWMPYIAYGVGLEYLITDKLAVTGRGFVNQILSDSYDGSDVGTFNDYVWGAKLGFKIYLGK